MDAHSRVRYMLHKCNRARREHVASNMLFYRGKLSYRLLSVGFDNILNRTSYKMPI